MLLGAGTVLTKDQADRAMAAGASSSSLPPALTPMICQHVIDKGGIMMPGTATAGEMQQAMNMGLRGRQVLPCRGQRRRGQAESHRRGPYKTCKWMPTGGVNAKNLQRLPGL